MSNNEISLVDVAPEVLALCRIKAASVDELTRDEIKGLMNWCDHQSEDLWEGMTLQEILNVYRVSAEYDTFEGMAEEMGNAARVAWNKVVRPINHLRTLEN